MKHVIINLSVILLVNLIFVALVFSQKPSLISKNFAFIFYFSFYLFLSLAYILYFTRKRKSLFLATMIGLVLGCIIGSFSFIFAELTIGNMQFILNELNQYGIRAVMSTIFTSSLMISFHFLVGGLSMFTCFLIIEKITPK